MLRSAITPDQPHGGSFLSSSFLHEADQVSYSPIPVTTVLLTVVTGLSIDDELSSEQLPTSAASSSSSFLWAVRMSVLKRNSYRDYSPPLRRHSIPILMTFSPSSESLRSHCSYNLEDPFLNFYTEIKPFHQNRSKT